MNENKKSFFESRLKGAKIRLVFLGLACFAAGLYLPKTDNLFYFIFFLFLFCLFGLQLWWVVSLNREFLISRGELWRNIKTETCKTGNNHRVIETEKEKEVDDIEHPLIPRLFMLDQKTRSNIRKWTQIHSLNCPHPNSAMGLAEQITYIFVRHSRTEMSVYVRCRCWTEAHVGVVALRAAD